MNHFIHLRSQRGRLEKLQRPMETGGLNKVQWIRSEVLVGSHAHHCILVPNVGTDSIILTVILNDFWNLARMSENKRSEYKMVLSLTLSSARN